jgi:hypothetical protein
VIRASGVRIVQCLLEFLQRELPADIGKIRPVRLAARDHHMTGSASSFSEEEAFPGGRVSGRLEVICRGVQRVDPACERIEFRRG